MSFVMHKKYAYYINVCISGMWKALKGERGLEPQRKSFFSAEKVEAAVVFQSNKVVGGRIFTDKFLKVILYCIIIMVERIVLVDFAGTLIKAEVIEEANVFRANVLQKALPAKTEHADPEQFYKVNREFVEKLIGLKANVRIRYRENDLDFLELRGEDVQNQISTNLFQIGMYMVAKKYGKDIVPDGLIQQLQRIKDCGYKLAIVSGVRTDIISGMLQIAQVPVEFDYIYGQPPILGLENQEADIKELQSKGRIEYCLGDKLSDLERGKAKGTKTIFVKWGHPAGGEEDFADYVIDNPKKLENIIR